MVVGLLAAAAISALGAMLIAPDVVATLACSAAENLPCRPLTLECLFAGAGGLAAGLPAVPPGWGGFPTPDPPREYAPNPPPGYQPPAPPPDPQDAFNDPEYQRRRNDYFEDQKDRERRAAGEPPSQGPGHGWHAGRLLTESIRANYRR